MMGQWLGCCLGGSTGLGPGVRSPGLQPGPSLTCCVTQEVSFSLWPTVSLPQRTTSPASMGAPNRILESSPGSRLGCHLVASGGMAPGLESGL